MTREQRILGAVLLGALMIGCSGPAEPPPGPPFRPISNIGELMHDVVYPGAEIVWDAVGTIMTLEGTEEIQPGNEDEWVAVIGGARTLMESGNLLMMDGRAKDQEAWMRRSLDLIEAAEKVLEAAEARDAQTLFDRGELIYNACQGCHWEYRFEDDPNVIRSH